MNTQAEILWPIVALSAMAGFESFIVHSASLAGDWPRLNIRLTNPCVLDARLEAAVEVARAPADTPDTTANPADVTASPVLLALPCCTFGSRTHAT